jgi:hypothetical protein
MDATMATELWGKTLAAIEADPARTPLEQELATLAQEMMEAPASINELLMRRAALAAWRQ